MVGFGKSLRMARRPGWEGGYLDYETLKLLLSQIEAVYEEEAQRAGLQQPQHSQSPHEHYPASHSRRRRLPGQFPGRDFRRDLFLESDSDAAYGSVHQYDDALSIRSADEALLAEEAPAPKSFSLSYSHERHSSDDDDEEEEDQETGCGGGMFGWRGSSSSSKNNSADVDGRITKKIDRAVTLERSTSMRRHHHPLVEDEEDNFAYVHHEQQTSFLLTSDAGEETVVSPDMTHFSDNPTEKSSLLPPATPMPHGSSLYTLSGDLTPPASRMRPKVRPQNPLQQTELFAAQETTALPPAIPSIQGRFALRNRATNNQKLEQERQRARRRRRERKRKLRRLREARERKVPTYVRIAHSKARAIAERFLGLLRAETEKVLLFAQSRLGELADTAGSLRFPSYDDDNAHGRRKVEIQGALSQYDYPLADGGMHPSASSSSDDEQAAGLSGMFLWSDTEDDNDRVTSSGAMSGRTNETASQSFMSTSRTPKFGGSKKSTVTAASMIRRKLAHFQALRNSRPVFQRNDNILGEDMLFLSAVEEADGYTAVATELLHVLRFICVNLIAVRKICRKHDRLLMNRMLGGYYNRARSFENGHLGDSRTLGGLLVHASNDVFETHPALIGQMNRFKLVGIYDRKIQKLANSRTVQVISSCLALSLSEYEVARSRADNLTKLNASTAITPQFPRRDHSNTDDVLTTQNAFDSDDETGGPPSTASTISLTRLQFAVASIFSLREAARYKVKDYDTYLSRGSFVVTGQQVAGEGLDGCSRRSLDFIVSFEPDSVLLHDPNILFQGLQDGKWHKSLSKLMNSTLAASIIPENNAFTYKQGLSISKQELIVYNSVNVNPKTRTTRPGFRKDQLSISNFVSVIPDVTVSELRLSCISCFLFMANYFVAHPTSTAFVKTIEIASANSTLIIGAPNISAALCAGFHCCFISRKISNDGYPMESSRSMKGFFVFAALAGASGNIFQAFAATRNSVIMEVLGRLAIGFSFTEILNRHILSVCLPCFLVKESTRFLKYQIGGMMFGISLGTVAETFVSVMSEARIQSTELTSWVFSFLWFIHLIRICVYFNGSPARKDVNDKMSTIVKVEARAICREESDAESSTHSDEGSTSILQQFTSEESSDDEMNPLKAAYRSSENSIANALNKEREHLTEYQDESPIAQQSRLLDLKDSLLMIKSLLAFHFGIPVCLLNIAYTVFCWELLFSATPIIVARYFGWDGAQGGIYLCWLSMLVFPAHYISSVFAQRFEERTVLKRSLYLISVAYLGMVNWLSLYSLITRVQFLWDDIDGNEQDPKYDWRLGVFQYSIGVSFAFAGLVSLAGASASLLSKVSPHRQKGAIANIGTVVTFVTLLARFMADAQIAIIDLSHKLINTDLVNSLTFPMLLCSLGLLYLIKNHFFYLM